MKCSHVVQRYHLKRHIMGLRAICLTLVLGCYLESWGLFLRVITEDSDVLSHVLEAEIDATKQQLEHFQHKADLLNDAIKKLQRRNEHETMKNTSNVEDLRSVHTTPLRRSRTRDSPQLFSDWFEPQRAFKSSKDWANSTRMLTQLISFRPNVSPMGRRQQARRKNIDDEPPLQFLLVLDQESFIVSLFHPTSFELMWQHALDLRSTSGNGEFRVADMFFMSDRTAHLAILSTSGDLVLFKLRLWHNRRIVAGDTRRLKPLRDLEENHLQCPAGQDSINALNASQPPWFQPSIFTRTAPTPGRYLHVDVEHVFGATLKHDWHYDRGKVAVVPLYYRVLVVTSDSSGGHISFFHGDNGSFIDDIHTQISFHDSNVVHLEPIHSSRGLMALATQNRVFFVDATSPQLVPVVCEAPGRHRFTSLAADPLRPTVVYAGTSTGRVFVYKLHNFGSWRQRAHMSERESHGPVMCTMVDQLLPQQSPFGQKVETVVQTLPGFLVFGVGARLVLYQLAGSSEDVQPTYLSERSLVDSELDGINRQSGGHPRILGLSAATDLIVHSTGFAVLVLVPDGGHLLDIYESRIPPPGTNLDLTWIRVPAMMICALAAMFWQQKGRGGRNTFNEAELAGLLSGRSRLPNLGMKRGGLHSNRGAQDWY